MYPHLISFLFCFVSQYDSLVISLVHCAGHRYRRST
jgi:hypothetical protein